MYYIKRNIFSYIEILLRDYRVPLLAFILISASGISAEAQIPKAAPVSREMATLWQRKDLIEPASLATVLNAKKSTKPVIFNIGVVEDIKGAINVGASSKKENLEQLRKRLNNIPRSTEVVIYCGCCPFEKCPNIRPAFAAMKSMGFTKGKLLNLPVNLKQNWISKGYPMSAEKAG